MARTILHHAERSTFECEEEELTREFALEWQDSRMLVVCPRNYEDALEEVQDIFDLPPGRISLYTDSINSCPGKEFLITPKAWEGFWRKVFLPHVLVKVDMAEEYSKRGAKTRYHTPEVSSIAVPEKPKQEDTTLLCKKLSSTPRGLVSDMDDDTVHQDETNSGPQQEDMERKSQVMQPLDLNVVRKNQPTQVGSESRKNGDKIRINVSGPKGQRTAIKIRPHKMVKSVVTTLLEAWSLNQDEKWCLYIVPYVRDECGDMVAAGKFPCHPDESLEQVGGAYDRCEFVLENGVPKLPAF